MQTTAGFVALVASQDWGIAAAKAGSLMLAARGPGAPVN